MNNIPDKYKPLSPWTYFWLQILFNIPFVGFVFLIIFSISGSNINRRNFARSYFCVYVIILIIIVIAMATGSLGALSSLFSK